MLAIGAIFTALSPVNVNILILVKLTKYKLPADKFHQLFLVMNTGIKLSSKLTSMNVTSS